MCGRWNKTEIIKHSCRRSIWRKFCFTFISVKNSVETWTVIDCYRFMYSITLVAKLAERYSIGFVLRRSRVWIPHSAHNKQISIFTEVKKIIIIGRRRLSNWTRTDKCIRYLRHGCLFTWWTAVTNVTCMTLCRLTSHVDVSRDLWAGASDNRYLPIHTIPPSGVSWIYASLSGSAIGPLCAWAASKDDDLSGIQTTLV